MKFSNDEMVDYAESAIESIKMAMSELDGIDEYKEIYDLLDDAIDRLEEEKEPYSEAYARECEELRREEELEYMRSVL